MHIFHKYLNSFIFFEVAIAGGVTNRLKQEQYYYLLKHRPAKRYFLHNPGLGQNQFTPKKPCELPKS